MKPFEMAQAGRLDPFEKRRNVMKLLREATQDFVVLYEETKRKTNRINIRWQYSPKVLSLMILELLTS